MNFFIADWYVDVDTNRIHNAEQDIKLEGKVMTLLVYLANHPGEVISRNQLEADVWTDRVISYDALTSCITRLRKVLGDDSRKPLYIETVPKKGYRLIASVRWAKKSHPSDKQTSNKQINGSLTASTDQPENNRDFSHSIRSTVLLILLTVVVISGYIVITTMPNVIEPISELNSTPSIVVLPFDNLSGQTNQGYFSDGITADISIALSKLSALRVIATPSKQAEHTEQLARYILTGSVQRAKNKLRVNVILVDSSTQQQLWAESYDREITEVFAVQDNITSSIITALSIKLTAEEKQRIAHRYTNNINAYDQFLRGQALYTQRTNNENVLARQHFQHAIEIDPNFSRAYGALALTHVDDYRYRWYFSNDKSLSTAITLANKAVAIDKQLPQAHWALAYAQTHLHNYPQAITSLKRALEVRPNYADGYAFLALIHLYNDNPEQGLKTIRRAMQLNPNYPAQYLSVLGQAHYSLQEYEDALPVFRSAIDKNFSLLTAHMMLTATLSQLGKNDEASWQADQLHTIAPNFRADDAYRIFPVKDKKQLQNIIHNLRLAGIH
ncbi:MAG: hypothetical protein COA54_03655 [Thiotrichaceae bacterium]|nr:MAG: hypothetical protein COA54_03655 [Thiotrichaceae bacterium]